MPEILDGIKMIIIENDYKKTSHKKYIDRVLTEKGMTVAFSWATHKSRLFKSNFYEVWKN